jgi:hypothetical protein
VLLRPGQPSRPAFYPRGGDGRVGLEGYHLIKTCAPRPLNPTEGGGVVLDQALLTVHATQTPSWGGGGESEGEQHPLTMNVCWGLTDVGWGTDECWLGTESGCIVVDNAESDTFIMVTVLILGPKDSTIFISLMTVISLKTR